MKVRNVRNVMFAKGLDLDRDLQPGEVGMVKMGYDQSDRILCAIQSGALELVRDVTQVGNSIVHTPTADDGFESLVGKVHIGPRSQTGIAAPRKGESMTPDPSDIAANEAANDQLVTFKHLRGRAKAKFAEELGDLRVIRAALDTVKKGKVHDILERKLNESLPQQMDLDAIPEEGDDPKLPETIE